MDQRDPLDCDPIGERVVTATTEGLEVVREGVDADGGGQGRRQPEGEFRITDNASGEQLWMKDQALFLSCSIGDHRHATDLRAGSRSCRNGDDRRDRSGGKIDVATIFKLPKVCIR